MNAGLDALDGRRRRDRELEAGSYYDGANGKRWYAHRENRRRHFFRRAVRASVRSRLRALCATR